jgi:hypothetical protein
VQNEWGVCGSPSSPLGGCMRFMECYLQPLQLSWVMPFVVLVEGTKREKFRGQIKED